MLQKYRVVGATAQVAYRNIRLHRSGRHTPDVSDCFRWALGVLRAWLIRLSPLIVEHAAFRAGNYLCDFTQKLLQRGNSGSAKLRPGDGDIHIEVCDGTGQFSLVLLPPF